VTLKRRANGNGSQRVLPLSTPSGKLVSLMEEPKKTASPLGKETESGMMSAAQPSSTTTSAKSQQRNTKSISYQ